MKTLVLTQKAVRAILSMDLAVPAVERAFAAHGLGETIMPPKVYLTLPRYHGDFRAMPAYLDGWAGLKWVSAHPENPARHLLPAVLGTFILSDPATGAPLSIMDGTLLTAFRTGAAGTVATKHLSRGTPHTIGFVGCGAQARVLVAGHRLLYPRAQLRMGDVRPEAAAALADEAGGKAVSLAEAAGCDVVCVATPSRQPVVLREHLRPGAHVNAMGADAPGKQELDPQILIDGRVFVDDLEQAAHGGEVNVPLSKGILSRSQIQGTLGEVIAGRRAGRVSDEITVFDSTGLAIQDVALASVLYRVAREKELGVEVDLIEG
jgi:ornithine cyclodeaminase/alanine dehydrogenase